MTSHFQIDVVAFQGPIIIQSLESVLASFQQTLRLPYLEATAGGLFVDSVPLTKGTLHGLSAVLSSARPFSQCLMVYQGAMGAIV